MYDFVDDVIFCDGPRMRTCMRKVKSHASSERKFPYSCRLKTLIKACGMAFYAIIQKNFTKYVCKPLVILKQGV